MPTIKIKNSQTATNTPGSLVQGELAINEQDEILFYRDGAGAVQSLDLTLASVASGDFAGIDLFSKDDLTNARFSETTGDLTAVPNSTQGFWTSQDGLKAFIVQLTGTGDVVHEYDYGTAFDLGTLSASGNTYGLSAQGSADDALDVVLNGDGTKMFVLAAGTLNRILQYSLAAPYSLASAPTFDGFFSIPSSNQGLHFKPDGTKFWISNIVSGTTSQYSCSTPFVVTSGVSLDGTFTPGGLPSTNHRDVFFNEDGSKFYIGSRDGSNNNAIFQFSCSVAFDITTAPTLDFIFDASASGVGTLVEIELVNGGHQFNILSAGDKTVYAYKIGIPEHNAFTDAEKDKLAGIEAGAEVNPATTDEVPEGITNKYLAGNEVVSDTYITNIEAVTQAQYDALSPPDPNTFYTIVSTLPLPNTGYLDGVLASTMGDLDATISASYGGTGQTWSNLVASPADGNAQTAYDMFLGNTSGVDAEDPTFTGTAGNAAAYFDFTSGTRTYLDIQTNTTILNQLQSDSGQSWWIAVAFQAQTGTTSQFSCIWSNGGDTAANEGIEVLIAQPSNIFGIQTRIAVSRNGTRLVNNFVTGNYTNGNDYLLVVSYDGATDGMTVWKNTTTGVNIADINGGTGTVSSLGDFRIGDRINVANSAPMRTGTRLYHVSYGNGFLTDSDVTSIKSHLETRHSRTYNAA